MQIQRPTFVQVCAWRVLMKILLYCIYPNTYPNRVFSMRQCNVTPLSGTLKEDMHACLTLKNIQYGTLYKRYRLQFLFESLMRDS